ncbi:MAG: LPS export ABC transporter periplasmic protein LptC [Bacteroidetes bacterium]|nr:LPS export ABC transporter periplasmic protein LptC [Bacteroidota bacterium]
MKLLIFIIFIFFVAGCSEEKMQPSINSSLQVAKLPAQESWDDTVFFSDSGKTKAVLFANHLKMYDQPQETLLDTIQVNFYNLLGKVSTVLNSNKGKVDDVTKDLYAIDSVVAVNDSGVTLKTQELMWRNRDRKIVSDKFVTIISPKEKIQGYGFESDQNLNNYTIYNITYITRMDTSSNSKLKIKN